MTGEPVGNIYYGTSSWTDPTLVKSKAFYPPGAGNPEMVTEFFANHGASVMSEVVSGRQRSIQPSPMNRPGRPVDVAPAALYFASDESSYCTGTELVVDGGLHAGMYVDVPGMFSTT